MLATNLQYHFGIEFLSPRTNRPRSVTVRFFFAAYTNIPPSHLKTLLALLASLLRTFTHRISILRQQDMRNAKVRFSIFDARSLAAHEQQPTTPPPLFLHSRIGKTPTKKDTT